MPGDEFGATREAVGDAFDGAEPGWPRANRPEKRGQNGGRCFVAPIAEQAGEANTENRAVEPGLFFSGLRHEQEVYSRQSSSEKCGENPAFLPFLNSCPSPFKPQPAPLPH